MTFHFYFPNEVLGGVSYLFVRTARILAAKGNSCVLIDYQSGAMAKLIETMDSILVHTVSKDEKYYIEDGVLITQSCSKWYLRRNVIFGDDVRILLWNLHPYNLVIGPAKLRFLVYRRFAQMHKVASIILFPYFVSHRRFVMRLHKLEGIMFMDEDNISATSELFASDFSRTTMVPVGVDIDCKLYFPKKCGRDEANFLWVGRIADFKYPVLLYVLRFLEYRYKWRNIVFTLIGEGEYLEILRDECSRYTNIKVIFAGTCHDLETYYEQADLVFGMGTSLLEAARHGLPVIVTNPSYVYRKINDYKFRWFGTAPTYSLGGFGRSTSGEKRLGEMLDEYFINPMTFGQLARKHVEKYFNIEEVAEIVLNRSIRAPRVKNIF